MTETNATDEIESLFETTQALHGHTCPGSAMGLRAGLAARNALDVDPDANKELQCYVSTGPEHPAHCFIDGVQVATGCTYGKGNIEKLDHGKNALRLLDTESGREVRVSLDPEWFGHALENSPFIAERKKGIEPMDVDEEVTESSVNSVLTMAEDELLDVGDVEEFEAGGPGGHGSFYWEHCDACGEVTFEAGLRVVDGDTVCAECAGH
ncbi:MAG: FmdE family protein [Halobacteriales archaeon]